MAQFPSDFSILDSTCTLLSYLDLNNISNQHQIQNMEEIDNDEVMEVPDTPDRLRGRRNSGEESSSPLMGDRLNEFSSSLMGDFENSNKSRRNHVRPSLRSGNSNKKLYSRHMGDSSFREQSNKVDCTFISLLDSPTPSSVSANGHSRRTMGDQVFKVPAAPMPSALPRDPRGSSNVLKFGGGTSDNAEVVASAHKYLGNETMKNTVARSSTSCDTGSSTHSKIPMEPLTCEDDNTDLDSIVRADYAGMRQGARSHGPRSLSKMTVDQ
ncbi:hypothetical protein MKX01_039699 [Papaver californicum]|nr:hypothetical protein MKX01_039699 [Papaver californicum]